MAATSDPEGLFLGRKLLRESPEEVVPLDLLVAKYKSRVKRERSFSLYGHRKPGCDRRERPYGLS